MQRGKSFLNNWFNDFVILYPPTVRENHRVELKFSFVDAGHTDTDNFGDFTIILRRDHRFEFEEYEFLFGEVAGLDFAQDFLGLLEIRPTLIDKF